MSEWPRPQHPASRRIPNTEEQRQIVQTENLFREVNEQVQKLNERFGTNKGELIQVICECGRQECIEKIDVTVAEYEQVRSEPTLFAVKPGHLIPDVEQAESKNERYWIVRKQTTAEP